MVSLCSSFFVLLNLYIIVEWLATTMCDRWSSLKCPFAHEVGSFRQNAKRIYFQVWIQVFNCRSVEWSNYANNQLNKRSYDSMSINLIQCSVKFPPATNSAHLKFYIFECKYIIILWFVSLIYGAIKSSEYSCSWVFNSIIPINIQQFQTFKHVSVWALFSWMFISRIY